jgi:hypothetical protein
MDEKICMNCFYYIEVEEQPGIGQCHRYPPTPLAIPNFKPDPKRTKSPDPVEGIDITGFWSPVGSKQFCGEFKEKQYNNIDNPLRN